MTSKSKTAATPAPEPATDTVALPPIATDTVEFPGRAPGSGRKAVPSPYASVIANDAALLAKGETPKAKLIKCNDEQRRPVENALRRAGAASNVTVLLAKHADGVVFQVRDKISRKRKDSGTVSSIDRARRPPGPA